MVKSANPASSMVFSEPQVNLYTTDIERSIKFYHDALGLEEAFRTPKEGSPDHVEFRLGSTRLGIATVEALKRHHGISGGPGLPREEIVFFVDDVDGAYTRAVSMGAPSLSPPRDFEGYLHNARVADPDGNHVVFVTRLPVTRTADPETCPVIRNHLINLLVVDIEKSFRFYRDLFGFKETFRAPREGPVDHIEMELGNLNLAVSTIEALKRHHGISAGGGPPRGEVVVWTKDVDSAYSWLTARGVHFLSAPHNFAGFLRAAFAADPDGNPVQIVARSDQQ